MTNPLVSIMMPVFNGLPLIKASVESLMNQTYKNWECIIIDDGSNDATVLEITYNNGNFTHNTRNVRPLPEGGGFFENVWREYRENKNIF